MKTASNTITDRILCRLDVQLNVFKDCNNSFLVHWLRHYGGPLVTVCFYEGFFLQQAVRNICFCMVYFLDEVTFFSKHFLI